MLKTNILCYAAHLFTFFTIILNKEPEPEIEVVKEEEPEIKVNIRTTQIIAILMI